MATVRVDLTSQNTAQREILRLRGEMNRLNEQIARNNQLAIDGDYTTRQLTRRANQRIRAEQGLLRTQSQRQSLALANLRQEARELRGTTRATGLLSRATSELVGTLGAFGIAEVAFGVARFGAESVRAATQVEGFTRGFQSLGLSATQASQSIEELRQLARLPGIEFQQATQAAVRLRVIGIEGERANSVIRELGNALAITGDTDLTGAVRAITQIVQLGRVNQEEINQLVERSGAAAQALQDAFGTTRAEAIQATLEQSGQSVQDFVDILTNSLSRQARVSADSASNSFQNLRNATFELQAAIGERLVPTLTRASRGFTAFLGDITNFIRGTNEAQQAVNRYNNALAESSTAGDANRAIQDRIQFLETEKQSLEESGRAFTRVADRRTGVTQRQTSEYSAVTSELERLRAAEGNTALQADALRASQARLITQAQELSQQIGRLDEDIEGRNRRSVQTSIARRNAAQAELEAIQTEIGTIANAIRALTSVNTRATGETNNTTEAVENLSLELARASAAVRTYQSAFESARNIGASSTALQNVIEALNREQAAEEAYARETIENKQRLETELFNIEDTYNRERAEARARHEERARDARIQAARRASEVESGISERNATAITAGLRALTQPSVEYAQSLIRISDAGNRAEFGRLVERLQEQGRSFGEAVREAQQYIDVINSLSSTITRSDITTRSPNITLGQDTGNRFTDILSGFRQFTALFNEQEARLNQAQFRSQQNEERAFAARPGRDVLGDIRQQARDQSTTSLLRERRRQIRELAQSTARVERTIDGALTRIGGRLADTFVNVLIDGKASLQDFGREFLSFSARILIQTGLQIAQEKALQAEIARTNALRTAGLTTSVANPTSALSLLTLLIPGAAPIFHNPISDRIAGEGGRQSARFLFDAGISNQVTNGRDFTGNFVPEFTNKLRSVLSEVGATQDGAGDRQPIVFQLGGRTVEEFIVELDNMEQSGRVVRRRKSSSLVGR